MRAAVGKAATLQVPDATRLEALAELVNEPRLADAGLAHDAHDLPAPLLDPNQILTQHRQLSLSAYETTERHPADLEPTTLMTNEAIRRSDVADPRSCWFQLDSPLQEFGTARVHQDGAGLGPLEKCIESAPRLAAMRRIHTHDIAGMGDQASAHVDREPPAQMLGEAAFHPLQSLEHGAPGR